MSKDVFITASTDDTILENPISTDTTEYIYAPALNICVTYTFCKDSCIKVESFLCHTDRHYIRRLYNHLCTTEPNRPEVSLATGEEDGVYYLKQTIIRKTPNGYF